MTSTIIESERFLHCSKHLIPWKHKLTKRQTQTDVCKPAASVTRATTAGYSIRSNVVQLRLLLDLYTY